MNIILSVFLYFLVFFERAGGNGSSYSCLLLPSKVCNEEGRGRDAENMIKISRVVGNERVNGTATTREAAMNLVFLILSYLRYLHNILFTAKLFYQLHTQKNSKIVLLVEESKSLCEAMSERERDRYYALRITNFVVEHVLVNEGKRRELGQERVNRWG